MPIDSYNLLIFNQSHPETGHLSAAGMPLKFTAKRSNNLFSPGDRLDACRGVGHRFYKPLQLIHLTA